MFRFDGLIIALVILHVNSFRYIFIDKGILSLIDKAIFFKIIQA